MLVHGSGSAGEADVSWPTHEVANQFDELADYNLLLTDTALYAGLNTLGASWALPALGDYGASIGSARSYRMAEEANRYVPELRAFDRRGRRIDQVEFHPSWHALLGGYRAAGFVTLPYSDARPGRWAAAAAACYLHAQVEAGTMCPASMTLASVPVLQKEPALWSVLGDKLYDTRHDVRDLPLECKTSAWIGMGMTEKQGGSDVRSNTTSATAEGAGGRGAAYRLRGHKWFFSAPMCDAHLVVARSPHGHSCFYVPRWQPDGTRNAVQIQRLKDKVGNRSNASSEVEFLDAWGLMLGEEGHGIRTIIEMATGTRLSCVVASAGFIRQCLVQAIAYTRRRSSFGRPLIVQPLMRAVLADLALESEAAVVLMLRLASAFEDAGDPRQRPWLRIMTPAAKFWICKRAVELCGEAMEIFGGNGYVDDSVLARLYREAPVNSIWEGSGNVMCLDVLRALGREPDVAGALLDELDGLAAGEARLAAAVAALRRALDADAQQLERCGRRLVGQLVLAAQACLLRARSPEAVSAGFAATRLESGWGHVVGAVDTAALDVEALIERAFA
jgi:putative acyl-CoA dehydrogenase